MKLNNITVGMWRDISNYLNYNFNKLSIATNRLENVGAEDLSFKGVFDTETLLTTKYPNPGFGDFAFILIDESGETKFSVYQADEANTWVQLEGTYDPEVILKNYIETIRLSDIDDLEDDIEDYLNNN